MTSNTLTIELQCNGSVLRMGPHEELDITNITGLESSDIQVMTSENALVDGASVDGKKIKPRSIHIEASFRDSNNNSLKRQRIIRFFNPKYTGRALIENTGTPRNIEYELEGWSFKEVTSMDEELSIIVDLICPDPYMQNVDNFGRNMASVTPLFAFPWRVLLQKADNLMDYPEKVRGLLLGGATMGYRTLKETVMLANDGDVETGLIIKFTASRGPVSNPKIIKTSTGEYMRVMVDMKQGDILVVDTNERHQIIELNGVNCYQKIDRKSEPFRLDVGENELKYEADANYVNLDVNIYYTPKYLGV